VQNGFSLGCGLDPFAVDFVDMALGENVQFKTD
jgi:hypothetical protein